MAAERTWRRPLIGGALALLALALLAGCARRTQAAFDFDLNELPAETDEEFGRPAAGFTAAKLDERERAKASVADEDEDEAPVTRSAPKKRRKMSHGQPTAQPARKSLWARVRSGLPNYFNFSNFKEKFRRKYRAAEAFLRQSLFLRKCIAILRARLDFRLGRKSYLESVNQFSDRTPQEFHALFMAAPPVELGAELASQRPAIERRLRLLEELNGEHYVPELPSQAAASGSGTALGEAGGALLNERLARRLVEQIYERQRPADQLEARHFEEALIQELDGFNVERETQSANGLEPGARQLPWPGAGRAPEPAEEARELARAYAAPKLARGETLDWSLHECFHEIYAQGNNCGKCYVMASTALAEFYKCSERGPGKPVSKRKFSKEYVLECAQKYTPNVMGCAGGSPLHTLRFIAAAGIFNIRDWRQRRSAELKEARQLGRELDALDLRCPLSAARTPLAEWGPIRVEMNPRPVGAAGWKEALEDGPLVASVQMPAEGVDSYAGGVHDGRGCATSGAWHAMLLVGYGTSERGQQFWRFRNSFGPDWGDAGHFNLAMDVPGACLPGGVRVFREPLADL